MIDFAYYLLKVFICSSVFFLYYRIALLGKEFHQWNRFYLLITAILSLLIPCLKFSILLQRDQAPNNIVYMISSADEYVAEISAASWQVTLSAEQWSVLLYGLICSVLALIFIHSLLKIRKMIHHQMIQVDGNIKLIETNAPGTPFSFFRYIFWNPDIDLQSETGQQILQHEIIHVQQKHTLDKMLMQTILVLFWCNPVFWLIRKELSMIHEFIADQRSVGSSGATALAAMILQASCPGALHQFTNPFFKSSIKRRLAMLTKNHDPRFRYITRIFALPVLAVISLAFTVKIQKATSEPAPTVVDKPQTSVSGTIDAKNYQIPVKSLPDTLPRKAAAAKNDTAMQKALLIVDGKEAGTAADLNKIESSSIASMAVWKDGPALAKFGEKGKNGVIEIFTREYVKANPDETPLKISAKENDTEKSGPDVNKIFEKAEVMPQFPGGVPAWQRYLQKNLNANVPVDKRAPAGTYKVVVKFIVDPSGNLSAIEPLTKHGYGMEEEVIRLISKGPKWVPAMQNGHPVASYHMQPVTFVIEEGNISPEAKPDITTNAKPSVGKDTVPVKSGVKLTTAQLTAIPFSKLIQAGVSYPVESCRISIEVGKDDVKEFAVAGGKEPAGVKSLLSQMKAGEIFTIDSRKAIVDGKEKKFPAVVFFIQ